MFTRARRRVWIAGAVVALIGAVPIAACTDGTTPDCSSPDSGCAPDLSGNVEGGGDVEASPAQDVQTIDVVQPILDAGDASRDGDADRG